MLQIFQNSTAQVMTDLNVDLNLNLKETHDILTTAFTLGEYKKLKTNLKE